MKNVYLKVKTEGMNGLLKAVYRRIVPQRLEYYPRCKSFFTNRIGLEIGGPSSVFGKRGCIPVYPVATRIDNCNFGSHTVWEGDIAGGYSFVFDDGKAPGRQYVVEASNLQGIEDACYDFVLSSHCIEHLANPLQGLAEWLRVLKEDGLLILIIPHKDGTFDHRRPVTSLDHLIQDFDTHTDEADMTHLEEILNLHDLSKDPGAGDFQFFRDRSKRNVENRCLHHHVFDTRLAVELVNHAGCQILAVELFLPYHIMIIARKVRRNQVVNNETFRGIKIAPCWLSPFPSDHPGHRGIA